MTTTSGSESESAPEITDQNMTSFMVRDLNSSVDFDAELKKFFDFSYNLIHYQEYLSETPPLEKEKEKEKEGGKKGIQMEIRDIDSTASNTSKNGLLPSFIIANRHNHLVKMMILKQDVINRHIGTKAWKFYISSAIWNYTTTIINFSITLLTALSTGTVAGSNILSQQQTVIILFVTFILTITNSFFKLNVKMNLNFQAAKRYCQFGAAFEEIYYLPIQSIQDVVMKTIKYDTLLKIIHKNYDNDTIENQNYFTELIYLILINNTIARGLKGMNNRDKYSTWIRNQDRHIELDGTENTVIDIMFDEEDHNTTHRKSSVKTYLKKFLY